MKPNSLEYSTDALNVKSQFFNKTISVYVEGKEDIIFWDSIFKYSKLKDYHIEESNGKENLQILMNKIIDEDARIIVAIDCDHSPFLKDYKYHNRRIIKTFGYSIENTMYCYNNIEQTIKRFAKTRKNFQEQIRIWYKNFSLSSKELLNYDVANVRFSKSTRVFGDKCNRFLKSEDSYELSQTKINNYISSIISKFSEKEINETSDLIDADDRELRYLIKGHFLTNGVINLIKQTVLQETGFKITISIDSLYSLMVTCLGNCQNDCEDMNYLSINSKSAFDSLKN